jgi:hypothetical protein
VRLHCVDIITCVASVINLCMRSPAHAIRTCCSDHSLTRAAQLDDLSAVQDFIKGLGSYQAEHKSLGLHTAVAGACACVCVCVRAHV